MAKDGDGTTLQIGDYVGNVIAPISDDPLVDYDLVGIISDIQNPDVDAELIRVVYLRPSYAQMAANKRAIQTRIDPVMDAVWILSTTVFRSASFGPD